MITSNANGKVKQVVLWQTKAKERRRDGIFLAEGFKMYEEAPADSIVEVYVSEETEKRFLDDRTAKNHNIWRKLQISGYEVVSDEVFAKMSDTQTPQGILCVLKRPEYDFGRLLKQEKPLFVILENLQDPGNLGTILRTGEGAGITGVIMTEGTVDVFNPKTIRATMGSVFRVPFAYVDSIQEAMESLHKEGIHTYAAHLEGKTYYQDISYKEPTAFLIGNEGGGLSKEAARLAERYIKIPMEGRVESLNAAVAAAVLMYEAHRQRN